MIEALSRNVRRYVAFSNEDIDFIASFLDRIDVNKKEFILKEGQTCRARYFIVEGCFRSYFHDIKGNEQILHFGIENWWITDYDSLVNKIPSILNIQAIESSIILKLKESDLDKLSKQVPQIQDLFRIIAEKSFIAAQRRIHYLHTLNGEEMYHTFANANPNFIQRVPQYMTASYLDMTPEFLSKIRAKK